MYLKATDASNCPLKYEEGLQEVDLSTVDYPYIEAQRQKHFSHSEFVVMWNTLQVRVRVYK